MAAVTVLGTTFNTTAGNKTVVATPAANDLIVIVGAASLAGNTWVATDDNADGLGAYTEILNALSGVNSGRMRVAVRNGLVGSATSTTFTATITSDSGGGLTVLAVSGMSKTGSTAVLTSGSQASQAAGGTPAPVLSATPQSGNPIVGGILNGSNPAGMTPRTGYTEHADVGYATPTQGLEVISLNSGETTATITWGGTSATGFASAAIELDTSATSISFEVGLVPIGF